MYKIFIVEDEPLIRQSIRNYVENLSDLLPLEYCGEATDGELGLAMIQDLQPDIVLSDIKMPFLNGLDMIKIVKSNYPWIQTIVISGFDDFDYTQQAINIGVNGYLLKPIKKEQLEEAIKKCITNIEENQKNNNSSLITESFLISEINTNQFLNLLFSENYTTEQVIEYGKEISYDFIGKYFCVILCKLSTNLSMSDLKRLIFNTNESFKTDSSVLSSLFPGDFIKFLISSTSKEEAIEKSYHIANLLKRELTALENGCSFSIVIGDSVSRISEIHHSYKTAKDLFNGPLVKTDNIISYYDHNKLIENSDDTIFLLDVLSELTVANKNDLDKIHEYLTSQSFDDLVKETIFRFQSLQSLNQYTAQLPCVNLKKEDSVIKDVNEFFIIASDKIKYEKKLDDYFCLIKEDKDVLHLQTQPVNHTIQDAQKFINNNYNSQDISLNTVAENVSLSPTHFSTLFSQTMGITFIEYLTKIRLLKAKELLKTTQKKLVTIALEVGYNDPNYFSFLFKKHEGISPSEFRNKI